MLDRSVFAGADTDAGCGAARPDAGRMRRPIVSVIVTNYNYARYVADCLGSILAQTVPPSEVIVVDDASTDDSVAAIERFIAGHDDTGHVTLHRTAENAGQMSAFIDGFSRSSGDFVVFVDADDWLFPDFIETHLAAHLNPDFTAGLTCSSEIIVDGDNRVLAGSIDAAQRGRPRDGTLGQHCPVAVREVTGWRHRWTLGDPVAFDQDTLPLGYVGANDNEIKEWIWTTTSAVMLRRGVLDICLRDSFRDVRICADYLLLHFCHLVGGSLLIPTAHGAYRRHGANNFAANATIGRGIRAGNSEQFSFAALRARIETELLDNFAEFEALFGKPRLLQTLGAFVPARRLPAMLAAAGPGRWLTKTQLLAFVAIKRAKLGLLYLQRLARFL